MAPYFSVILPVYNVKDYLQRCVRSVQSQEFPDCEMILVDDGSTDGSGELCDCIAGEYDNVTVIHKENGGLASARNAGMEIARGTYIWFVDSDDWIEPGSLKRLWEVSAPETPDIVKFNYYRVEKERSAIDSNASPGVYETAGELLDLIFFSAGKYMLSACTHIYRTAFLRQYGVTFLSERLVGSEDYLFNVDALLCAKQVVVIPDRFYNYEQRLGSLTQKYRKNLIDSYTRLYYELRDSLARHGLLEAYERKLCRMYVRHLLHSCGIPNEYIASPEHSLREGRKNVRKILRSSECRYAVACCDRTGLTRNQRIQLLAMRWGIEPVFCWLWKGKQNENQIKTA